MKLLKLGIILFLFNSVSYAEEGKETSFGAYGEANLVREQGAWEGNLERVVAFIGHRFNDRIRFFAEIELEDAKKVEAEQAFLDFDLGSQHTLRAGLVLVPVGLINLTHEPPTFYGVLRSEVDTRLIPTTWRELGAGALGRIGDAWQYQIYVLNGLNGEMFRSIDGIREGRGEGSKAAFDSVAVAGRLTNQAFSGLNVATSFYYGGASQDHPALSAVRVGLVEADLRYLYKGFELKAEYARIFISNAEKVVNFQRASDPTFEAIGSEMQGYYIEAAYNVIQTWAQQNWALLPFLRYEVIDMHATHVPIANAGSSASERYVSVGLSYKPIPDVVIKGDYRRGFETPLAKNRISLGLGFVF